MKITENQAIQIFKQLVDQAVGNGHAEGVFGTMIISPDSIDETVDILIENDPTIESYAIDAGVNIEELDLQSELSQHAHFQYAQCVVEAKHQFESITSSCNLILGSDEEIYVEENDSGELVITVVDLCGDSSAFPKPSIGEKLADYYKRCTN